MSNLTGVSNECFKCRNRFCSTGIISCDDDGHSFNEIACSKHTDDLYKQADNLLGKNNGVMRLHISSSSVLSRRIMKLRLKEHQEESEGVKQ